jgi:hypothetical protein
LTARNEETALIFHEQDRKAVLARVLAETGRQIEKWGIQHHPDGTGRVGDIENADRAKALTDRHAETGDLTWRDIFIEEAFESLAEAPQSEKLVEEIIQAAAVLVSWAVDIESRKPAE